MPTSLLHRTIVEGMRFLPRPVIWHFSQRYIAGTRLADAFRATQQLNNSGCAATIDVLGEDSTRPDQVEAAKQLYLEALDGIATRSLDCGISVKLSELGLRFDQEACMQVLRTLLDKAKEHDNFLRIDMEDSSVTTATLDIYRDLRSQFDNVGTVIQSCLRRSREDVAELLQGGMTDLRLCKGIYVEPEEIAYRNADEIRGSFQQILEQLLESDTARVGIATHDPALVLHAEQLLERLSVPRERYEFQMLLGVAGPLRRRLLNHGHPVRVYVPFGELWYDYSLRRLRENPAIAGHIVRNLFGWR